LILDLDELKKKVKEKNLLLFDEIERKMKKRNLLLFDEDEEKQDDFLYYESDAVVRYPPDSNPPTTHFNNTYTFQKGLIKIYDKLM
jgi:hypothetical protein